MMSIGPVIVARKRVVYILVGGGVGTMVSHEMYLSSGHSLKQLIITGPIKKTKKQQQLYWMIC